MNNAIKFINNGMGRVRFYGHDKLIFNQNSIHRKCSKMTRDNVKSIHYEIRVSCWVFGVADDVYASNHRFLARRLNILIILYRIFYDATHAIHTLLLNNFFPRNIFFFTLLDKNRHFVLDTHVIFVAWCCFFLHLIRSWKYGEKTHFQLINRLCWSVAYQIIFRRIFMSSFFGLISLIRALTKYAHCGKDASNCMSISSTFRIFQLRDIS